MNQKLAKAISYITSPVTLFLLPYLILCFHFYDSPSITSFVATFIIVQLPLMGYLYYLAKTNKISQFTAPKPQERQGLYKIFVPLLVILAVISALIFSNTAEVILISLAIAIVEIFAVILYSKNNSSSKGASYDLAMQGTLLGIAVYMLSLPLLLAFIITTIATWSSITTLKTHSKAEMSASLAVGLFAAFFVLQLYFVIF